jgi:Uma2 family endonuclease
MAGFRRFSVAEYHRLIELGILTEDDNLELLDGYLVLKMGRNPPHDGTLDDLDNRLRTLLPSGWIVRCQCALTLTRSEPEPDLAVVRQEPTRYRTRHPTAADVGLVIEVADSTLASDRADKGAIYAEAGIACYWIVNIPDRQIEVYTSPSGPTAAPAYAQGRDYRPGDSVAVVLDSTTVATLAVRDVLP